MKFKLDNDLVVDSFFDDIHLLGIVAPVKDYRFIWHINKYLGFSFKMKHEHEISLIKKNRHYYFSVYQYTVPGCCIDHYLYNNEDDGEYLLPELKHLDFLWLTKGVVTDAEAISDLQRSLKEIPGVQLVNEMTNEKIRNKEHLIL